jgi:hypothetical protein
LWHNRDRPWAIAVFRYLGIAKPHSVTGLGAKEQ